MSAGCDNCYAETMSHRNPAVLGEWGPDGTRALASGDYWRLPFKWERMALAEGRRHRVFSLSLGDWLEDRPELIAPRARLLATIGQTPNLDWLLLTKRPEGWRDRIADVTRFFPRDGLPQRWLAGNPPPNVWLGVSCENQETADQRIPLLLQTPAEVRFASYEPALEGVDFGPWLWEYYSAGCNAAGIAESRRACGESVEAVGTFLRYPHGALHWLIVGGESGHGARPFDLRWAERVVEDCKRAGVACFVKQLGARPFMSPEHDGATGYEWPISDKKGGKLQDFPEHLRVREFPAAGGTR